MREMKLLEKFFNEYFAEVLEHSIMRTLPPFPTSSRCWKRGSRRGRERFTVEEYGDHHTDIELKLQDLKNLLLKYVEMEGDLELRRRLLFALYELEFDLYIHSLIEEKILIPSGVLIEKRVNV